MVLIDARVVRQSFTCRAKAEGSGDSSLFKTQPVKHHRNKVRVRHDFRCFNDERLDSSHGRDISQCLSLLPSQRFRS
jgi:hypothetical protein